MYQNRLFLGQRYLNLQPIPQGVTLTKQAYRRDTIDNRWHTQLGEEFIRLALLDLSLECVLWVDDALDVHATDETRQFLRFIGFR